MIGLKMFLVAALCTPAPWSAIQAVASPAITTEPATEDMHQAPLSVEASLGRPEVARLLDDVLKASGIDDPAVRAGHAAQFASRLSGIEKEVGHARSAYRRARRLHDALHRHLLHRYVPTADGIDAILNRGDYNCVSATLFYGIAARAFDLDVHVIETPRHIFLRLDAGGRDVDIESTSAAGFDVRGDLERFRRFTWAYRYAAAAEMEQRAPYERFERVEEPGQPVSLERAAGFLWHNTAERSLARGEALKAAASFVAEFRAYPDLANRSDGFATSLARAFRIEYEAGRFETAQEIAAMEISISPARTTSRDRFLAATSKRIETACERNDAVAAEQILDLAEKALAVPLDRIRLERESCPHVAAAAVRAGDWERAHRLADRYAAAEPDAVETGRFVAWVESRESGTFVLDHTDVCAEPQGMRPRRAPRSLESDASSHPAPLSSGGAAGAPGNTRRKGPHQ